MTMVSGKGSAGVALSRGIDARKALLYRWKEKYEYFVMHCSNDFYEPLSSNGIKSKKFDFDKNDMHDIDCAIVRGGNGTVSDCIAAQVSMLCIDDSNR